MKYIYMTRLTLLAKIGHGLENIPEVRTIFEHLNITNI
jgi:hypothetical protein